MTLDRIARLAKAANETKAERDIVLWRAWKKNPSDAAASALLAQVSPLIAREASKWDQTMARPLLETEGKRLAMQAFHGYDPGKGAALGTHLVNQLQRMSRLVYANQNVARLPENKMLWFHAYHKASARLGDELGRSPTTDEMADELGWSIPASRSSAIDQPARAARVRRSRRLRRLRAARGRATGPHVGLRAPRPAAGPEGNLRASDGVRRIGNTIQSRDSKKARLDSRDLLVPEGEVDRARLERAEGKAMSLLGLLNFVVLQWFCVRLEVSFTGVCPPGAKHRWWDREIAVGDPTCRSRCSAGSFR